MSDPVEIMREELRRSSDRVSSFFLVDSDAALARLGEKLCCLAEFGVTPLLVGQMVNLVEQLRKQFRPEDTFEEQIDVNFQYGPKMYAGCYQVRGAPGHGYEVELILPGVIASRAAGFLVNGFFCAFMPPSFYD